MCECAQQRESGVYGLVCVGRGSVGLVDAGVRGTGGEMKWMGWVDVAREMGWGELDGLGGCGEGSEWNALDGLGGCGEGSEWGELDGLGGCGEGSEWNELDGLGGCGEGSEWNELDGLGGFGALATDEGKVDYNGFGIGFDK